VDGSRHEIIQAISVINSVSHGVNQQKTRENTPNAAKKRQNKAKRGKNTKNLTTFRAKQSQFARLWREIRSTKL
jgi:hypothetical protein